MLIINWQYNMYIDSPEFVKRKVFNSKNNHSHVAFPQQYQYGQQRQMLARHVHQQLTEHKDDIQILQRFRKEAQQLKHQKFLAKKNRSQTIQQVKNPNLQSSKYTKSLPIKHNSSKLERQINLDNLQAINPQQVYNYESRVYKNRAGEDILHHYQRLLNSKEKELRKKQKKLEKSKVVIGKMGNRIKQLQQQKRQAAKQQELQIFKVNAIIEEMNYKIAENKLAFRQQLARLKFQMVDPTPTSLKHITTKRDLTNPVFPAKNKIYPKMEDSQRFLQGPSVYYEVPQDLYQKQIDSNIHSVGKGLGRMKRSQKFIENQFEKYRQL